MDRPNRPISRLPGLTATAAALVTLLAGPALAEQQLTRWHVWFTGGRSLVALSVEPADPAGTTLKLGLEGGGFISVPAARVRRTEQFEAPVTPEAGPVPALPGQTALEGDTACAGTCDPLVDPLLARWTDLARSSAERHGVDLNLVRAIMAVESCGDPAAISRKGAVGLMQLLPRTAADYGCSNLTDPASNIEAGCQHLARLQDKLAGNIDLVVAAYNAGEGAVQRTRGVPHYHETRAYVKQVRRHLERLNNKPDKS